MESETRQDGREKNGRFVKGCIAPVGKPYRKGQSGNPAGRPNGGLSILEWFNQMAGWHVAKIEEVLDDDKSPIAMRTAAIQWLQSGRELTNANGQACDRILDRTLGKPMQQVAVSGEFTGEVQHTHEVRSMMELVDKDPEAREALDLLANRMESKN